MRRGLLLLAGLLVLLVAADTALRRARQAERTARGALRPLVDPALQVVPERVRQLRLSVPGVGDFVYQRRGDAWRFPAYHDAWVHGDRVEAILQMLTTGAGTLVSNDADDHDELGVDAARAVRFELSGAGGPLLTVWVGHGIPGAAGDESYARRADTDSVLHLHANPTRAVGAGRPPLLDPRVLPGGMSRGPFVEARVRTPAQSYTLRRVTAPPAAEGPPMPLSGLERWRWVLTVDGRVDTCMEGAVPAWLGAVHRVRFVRLEAPGRVDAGLGEGGGLELIDETGRRETLVLGTVAGDSPGHDEVYVAHTQAGLLTVMPAAAAGLLTPPAATLLDSTFLRTSREDRP